MRLLLVRHGQSEGNVDKNVHHRMADHAIPLSKEGCKQAREAGRFLFDYLGEMRLSLATGKIPCRVWVSPYRRTRETAQGILEVFKDCGVYPESGVREHINLAEQQFGLFDGLDEDELKLLYPKEQAHYEKCEQFEGRFWARMPLGESRFDVAVRVHEMFGTFHRDSEKHRIDTLVIVGHGATIRAIVMQWLHLPFEWFEKEPNPKNCSIRLIENNEDLGYIFPGF